jgi:xanthine dehydrogenase accessory factor
VKPIILDELQRSRADKLPVALVSEVVSGQQFLVYSEMVGSSSIELSEIQLEEVRTLLSEARSGFLSNTDENLFVRSYTPKNRVIIIGAVHIAQYLADMATAAGFEIIIVDPRRGFVSEQRFVEYQTLCEWPDNALADLNLDGRTAIVVLSHDPKIDDPALRAALKSEVFYIGALGSIRTHGKRLERLSEFNESLGRISAPIGLKLGGRSPAEIAVSILAEIIHTLHRGTKQLSTGLKK